MFHRRPGVASDIDHGGVFTQRMDEHQLHALIAGVAHRPREQLGAVTMPPHRGQDRHAKLGAGVEVAVHRERDVGHGNQFQAAVVDAENRIPIEIETVHIGLDLGIRSHVAKAEIAIPLVQGL